MLTFQPASTGLDHALVIKAHRRGRNIGNSFNILFKSKFNLYLYSVSLFKMTNIRTASHYINFQLESSLIVSDPQVQICSLLYTQALPRLPILRDLGDISSLNKA